MVALFFVRDIMTPDPITVDSLAPVLEARGVMARLGTRHLPVVHEGQVVGILSNKDFSRRGEQVMDIMTAQPLTVAPDTPVDSAATIMAQRKVSSLLVVDEGHLVGIVTTYDMLDALVRVMRGRA